MRTDTRFYSGSSRRIITQSTSFGMIAIKALFDSLTLRHRYDYFPSIKQFVLRMPTPIHETVIRHVTRDILRDLDSIAERNDLSGEFAGNIRDNGSSRLTFPDSDYGPHDPDGSF